VDIRHVVVLMLENRSFDSMLGMLYASGGGFDGLVGTESNIWHRPDGSQQIIQVWNEPDLNARALCVPDPDPGELFSDIHMQIHGLNGAGASSPGGPSMGGFVDNYMRQPPTATAPDPHAVMRYLTPAQVPVISQLARAFGVSDRWHASAPCQTWPNRFFAHTATAGGYVNNSPTHFPYTMQTVFNRLESVRQSWRIYFGDIPQSVTLARLWDNVLTNYRDYDKDFIADAAAGTLPAYSFIEPRYFANTVANQLPNDQHPPHNLAYGEELIASVYNAVRGGPAWPHTLLIITFDEHGGCYDHVVPPPATPPGGPTSDGFAFDYFGVRVPAVIVSPYVKPGSVIRPPGLTPFDHTSILATLRGLFGFSALTARDAAAPSLLGALMPEASNLGPVSVTAPAVPPAPSQVARSAAKPPNDLQHSLSSAAVQLPTAGANVGAHIQRLKKVRDLAPLHATVDAARVDIAAHMNAFLGKSSP
jgi:phospholipase C